MNMPWGISFQNWHLIIIITSCSVGTASLTIDDATYYLLIHHVFFGNLTHSYFKGTNLVNYNDDNGKDTQKLSHTFDKNVTDRDKLKSARDFRHSLFTKQVTTKNR